VQGLDGKDQSPGRYVSVWKSQILPMILFPLIKILNCFQLWRGEIVPNASSGYYNRIIGAFLLVRADIFFLARGFDPKTFLYAEELIYNERIKKLGYKSYYFRDVRIIHECGAIISLTCSTSRTEIFFRESMLYYYTRYVGMSRLDRFMYDVAAMVYHCLWLPIIKIKRYIKSVK
jgi:GT2 family glycosyltransferase